MKARRNDVRNFVGATVGAGLGTGLGAIIGGAYPRHEPLGYQARWWESANGEIGAAFIDVESTNRSSTKPAPASAPTSASASASDLDVQGKEPSINVNRLRKAVQAIVLSAGSASADAQSAPAGSAVEPRGALDKEVVERVVAEHINEVKWCYDQERAKNPQLRGRVSVQFTITAAGVVSESKVRSSTTENLPLETCVGRCPRRWQFPKPTDGRPVIVTYPFEFPLRE